jgi:hypothetical protein
MSDKLCIFDKEGNYINFTYDSLSRTYNGDLMFHENSSDTFKTIALYLFEKIPSFEFQNQSLELEKFQLFNEFGFYFTGNKYKNEVVDKIETINNDNSFYSKWIYGFNFESKFPIGSEILFNSPIFEFSNPLKSYTVVSSKKGAIMILSTMNNQTFNNNYQIQAGLTSSYVGITIDGLNTIGVKNYVDYLSLSNNLSIWSEPNFYDLLYNGRKLNFINTQRNDGVVTIKNSDLLDKVYYQYFIRNLDLQLGQDLIIEVILKTDLPIIYKGGINLLANKIEFSLPVPKILRSGSQISINGSLNNQNFINISNIPTFVGNSQLTYYATASQVIFGNSIYQCVQAYTQSATSSVNPGSASYWTDNITYLPVDSTLTPETLLYGEIYLTSNKLYYGVSASGLTFSNSTELILSFAADKYDADFSNLNIDLYFENKTLFADLVYSSEYAKINFYQSQIGPTYSVGTSKQIYEKTIEIVETIQTERNTDISIRDSYNIVFTDIDEYGIIVEINGMVYQQEVEWIYSGLNVDIIRTVDKTLRAWLTKHAVTLHRLGISAILDYLVNFPYIYYDSIVLKSEYPNVPIQFKVLVGTTANFYIEHSRVTFFDIGNNLSITINGRRYSTAFNTDVETTLADWVDSYSLILDDYKIYTSVINSTLYFNIKSQDTQLEYSISVGKLILPGYEAFKINNRIRGNLGALVTSNAAILSSTSSTFFDINGLEEGDTGFATGMITAINNTIYPFDNQEYNLLEVNPDRLVFSYQGPFWGGTPSLTQGPFVNAAFDNGFSYSVYQISGGSSSVILGAFNQYEFDYSFDIIRGTNNTYTTQIFDGLSNQIDIQYINLSESVYVLGNKINVYDGLSGGFLQTINLPGLSQSLKLVYNNIDDYLYVLSNTSIYKIDPSTNFLVNQFSLTFSAYDAIVNSTNGDLYISYSNHNRVEVIATSGTRQFITGSSLGASAGTYKMAYNQFEDDIYVVSDNSLVQRINGTTKAEFTTYGITGSTSSIIYEPIENSIYVLGDKLYQISNNNVLTTPLTTGTFSDILFDNITEKIAVSKNGALSAVNLDNSISYNLFSNEYGYLSINQYEENLYLASQNTSDILVIDPEEGYIRYTVPGLTASTLKLIYNPLRRSMWGIVPSINKVIEISVELALFIVIYPPYYNGVYDSQYGTLSEDYVPKTGIWLKSRDYIRKPRENFEGEQKVKYVWKWLTDDISDIFMYDFSGQQLATSGPYTYIGEKPLQEITLNRSPNKDISKTASSAYQQTIFSEIVNDIDYINSSTNVSFTPEPLELFVGFNSQDEGVSNSTLILYKREEIEFSITTNSTNNNIITFTNTLSDTGVNYGTITLNGNSDEIFADKGLKVGQYIQLFVKDNTNTKNKYISFNNGIKFEITELYIRTIKVRYITNIFTNETTSISDYPSQGQTTFTRCTFRNVDREIGRFYITGQTEIEDIRYKTELSNAGKNITAEDVFIFKSYDINEQGVDWTFLNRKRKEMLMVKDDIFPYIGAYKSIINAINYFGYNDLELYEYYRNVNPFSKDVGKLFKVEIPDIFDNSVKGWTNNDYLKYTMPNPNYEDTNLFNLTYNITDKEGNNVLLYSLPEVITKLQGLKTWLEKNIIPLSHQILDITGRADFVNSNSIVHKNYSVKSFSMNQSLSPIDFKINEAYLMPVNSGSTVYNVVIDFYNQGQDLATNYFSVNEVPDYFDVKVRTYKTYPEWRPFRTYNYGDIITYYQQVYESMIDNNRINDPRKLQDSPSWNANIDYQQGQIVEYKRNFYEFIGTQSTIINGTSSAINPFISVLNYLGTWVDVTEWRKLDYSPVQTINEYRTATHSFHFTVDTNIDPFITVEVTSDNGYGQIYCSKKNYELRSILDIDQPLGDLDTIGPIKVYTFLTSTTTSTTTVPSVIVYGWMPIGAECEDDAITTTTTTSTTTTTTTAAPTTTTTTSTSTTTTTIAPTTTTTTTTTSTSTTTTTLPGMAFAGTTGTYSSTASACAAKTCGRSYYRPSSLPIFSIGMIVYDNASLTTPFNGAASWVAIDTSMTFCSGTGWYAIQIDTDGTILASVPC